MAMTKHILRFNYNYKGDGFHLDQQQHKPDKNLVNTVKRLEETPVTSHEAQQLQQARNDRRKQALHNSDGKYKENESGNFH